MADDRDRKRAAKRFNEHAKLLATFFDALSIATFGAAIIVPIAQNQFDVLKDGHWILIPAALERVMNLLSVFAVEGHEP